MRENKKQSIEKTFSLVSDNDLTRSAEEILKAKNVFIMARGTSKAVGHYLEHLLFSLGIHCFFIKDYNLSESFTNLVTKDDVIILISLSGNTKKIIDTARKVHMKKAKVISLTSFQSNILASYADVRLFSHTDETDTKRDDSISRIGFFLLVDLMIGTIKEQLSISTKI
ncbi:SIS domain-containing protein [Jeotgalibaca sp. MA1X17-3]|uniref:SIS domain-containing protein n=1 Tax=Jeotgalibaca sp. MA1X17-3 TaxID=2908211 RepID=UPI0037BEFF48